MENVNSKLIHEQWKIMTGWITGNIKLLTDDELKMEISPGKNNGVWLLGHLIESEDDLSKFLEKGPMLFPHYEEMFGQSSKLLPIDNYPPIEQLRKEWLEVVNKNDKIISSITDKEWNEPPNINSGSDNIFQTKGRCIMIWILHQMYHNGQLAVLISKAGKAKY